MWLWSGNFSFIINKEKRISMGRFIRLVYNILIKKKNGK